MYKFYRRSRGRILPRNSRSAKDATLKIDVRPRFHFRASLQVSPGGADAGLVHAPGRSLHARVPRRTQEHSLLEICKKPALAAEVTITAAEASGVDAAIIFADLLLPLEVMGLPFHFSPGEGPVDRATDTHAEDIAKLRTDRAVRTGVRRGSGGAGRETFWHQAARHRLLRRAVHAGQLHDRRRRLPQLHSRQEDDVQLPGSLERVDGKAGRRNGGIFIGASSRWRRRHSDFRQLGRMPER